MNAAGIARLLRLPLFITAVADVIAGYVVALLPSLHKFDWHIAGLLAGTSTGLYLFGMVENDLVDIRRDRLLGERRPLVTGEVGIPAAVVLLILTAVLAGVCAGQLLGGALVLAIAAFVTINLYNMGAKGGPAYVAMPVMGLCRLLNFGIGVTAAIGVPRELDIDLLLHGGPLWMRHGLALFCATAVITGYSIAARRGERVTTRVWQGVLVVSAVVGFGLIALSTAVAQKPSSEFVAPVARVFVVLLLAGLWPGGLWSPAGPERKPEEYAPFIERALYWLILLDVAFVLDGLLIR
jgi:4-hydroxybenzoate polyprenyltransferase